MKKSLYAVCLAALLACTTAATADNRMEEFSARSEALQQQVLTGAMTELDGAKEMAALAEKIFPEEYNLHAFRKYKVLLASRLERGEIQREEFDYLWSEKIAEFQAKRAAEISRQQFDAGATERNVYAQQQAADEARTAAASALFLQGVGNAFRNAAPRTPVRCTSVPVGASISTNCY